MDHELLMRNTRKITQLENRQQVNVSNISMEAKQLKNEGTTLKAIRGALISNSVIKAPNIPENLIEKIEFMNKELNDKADDHATTVNLGNLQDQIDELEENKAEMKHKHSMSDITDYVANHKHNSSDITFNSNIIFKDSGTNIREIRLVAGRDDCGRIAVGATENSHGWMEIAAADDLDEPIYVRQYKHAGISNQFNSVGREAVLLDATGNTSFPGTLTSANVKADNETRLAAAESSLTTKADASHTHTVSEITDYAPYDDSALKASIEKKADVSHKHTSSDITFNSNIIFADSGTDTREIRLIAGKDDCGRLAFGSTATNAG